jgi:hypothetical protein
MSNNPLDIYRKEDLDLITKNLGNLENRARAIYLQNYEPTLEEINKVYEVIKQYIRDNNLIVYGGYAQNSLIKAKNENDGFYSEVDVADIEFYTPDPLKDLINLCDLLYKKDFKHVEGKEGVHPETYKIFVNFINYCDFSYMPQNVFENCPTIKVEGMRMTHPHFMLVDAYRVYTDPMTSYFRLTKTFTRFNKLINYYPFSENNIYNKIEYQLNLDEREYDNINTFIFDEILRKHKLIVVGHRAFNRLMRKAGMSEKYMIQEPFLQVISTNFNEDRNTILNILKKKFGNKISYVKYNPFFQFLDKSVEFYYNKQLILRLYGGNERCVVNTYSENSKIYYGTFQLQILYALSNYILSIIRKNKFNQSVYITMITRLFKAREDYFDKNKLNILSKSPFEGFTLNCTGEPVDPIRSALLKGLEKKKQGKQMKFQYRPTGKAGKVPDYGFANSTGDKY